MHDRMRRTGWLISMSLVAMGSSQLAAQATDYTGFKALRVTVTDPAQLDQIEQSGAIILDCIPRVGEITVVADDDQLAAISALNVTHTVTHQNVAEILQAQKAPIARGAPDPFDDFFTAYRQYNNGTGSIVWYLNELAARYPDQAELINIGSTLEGQTIWGLHVTDLTTNAIRPEVVYFGCEHAREWITPTAPLFFGTHLLEQYALGDAAIVDLVDNVGFYLIPVFNVDGYEYSWSSERFWRKNRRNNGGGSFGVDLNRNWGEGWGGQGASSLPGSDTYRGASAFSEPETQVLRDFFINHPNVRAQLDIHSFTQLILWPFASTSALPPDQDVYEQIGFGMQSDIFNVYGLTYTAGPVYTTIYPASGGSLDWTYVQQGILSFSFEMRPSGGGLEGFDPSPALIIPNNEELLPAMLRLSNSDWVRNAARFIYDAAAPIEVLAGQPTTLVFDAVGQLGNVNPASVTIHYRTDPSLPFVAIPASHNGGDNYEAVIPATHCLSQIEYYASASTDLGMVALDPRDAPNQLHTATMVEISLAEDFETDSGWQVGAVGDIAVSGIWERADPVGTAAQPEDDHTPGVGTDCFVTGAGLVGGALGDDDVDLGKTTLVSPVLDLSQTVDPVIAYWRWYSNDEGAAPNEDVLLVEIAQAGNNFWTEVETVGPTGPQASGGWFRHSFRVSDITTVADSMQIRFVASDFGSGSIIEAAIDDLQVLESPCVSMSGDGDGDGDLDMIDFEIFAPCMTGPTGSAGPACAIFDFDSDGDVDAQDHAMLQSALN